MKTKFTLSLDKTTKYLLALSGGADSVYLFHLLIENGIYFEAAHINHGIRGNEADRDEEFCRSLAKEHGIEFHLLRADVPAIALERGESLEEAARNVRYDFFEKVMRERSIPLLLTAHNADDNAETLLLALTRGASPSGACGIPRERELAFGRVIRPILSLSKSEIIEHCRKNSYDFVTDSTNSDTSYSRNRIRQNVIPELAAINPQLLSAIARFTEAQKEENELLNELALQYLNKNDFGAIAETPRPIALRALNIAAYRAGARPETLHLHLMLKAAKLGGSVSLPGGIIFSAEKGKLSFAPECRTPKNERTVYPEYSEITLAEGKNSFGEGKITIVCGELTKDCPSVHNLSISANINLDRIKGQLRARPRREGDKLLIGGVHKSAKKLISEKLSALPLEIRRSLPVITCGEEIVWIPGLPVSDEYRAKENTRVLTLHYCI